MRCSSGRTYVKCRYIYHRNTSTSNHESFAPNKDTAITVSFKVLKREAARAGFYIYDTPDPIAFEGILEVEAFLQGHAQAKSGITISKSFKKVCSEWGSKHFSTR